MAPPWGALNLGFQLRCGTVEAMDPVWLAVSLILGGWTRLAWVTINLWPLPFAPGLSCAMDLLFFCLTHSLSQQGCTISTSHQPSCSCWNLSNYMLVTIQQRDKSGCPLQVILEVWCNKRPPRFGSMLKDGVSDTTYGTRVLSHWLEVNIHWGNASCSVSEVL